mmetsp:Transcript_486/g.769  ORF Transcript_486/g.769 Transcript_486/m.769 type:complete len:80 (+) Transcript_486:2384-2623(+)
MDVLHQAGSHKPPVQTHGPCRQGIGKEERMGRLQRRVRLGRLQLHSAGECERAEFGDSEFGRIRVQRHVLCHRGARDAA